MRYRSTDRPRQNSIGVLAPDLQYVLEDCQRGSDDPPVEHLAWMEMVPKRHWMGSLLMVWWLYVGLAD